MSNKSKLFLMLVWLWIHNAQMVLAVDDVYGNLITFTDTADAPNGGWCWFQDERIIVDRDHPDGPTLIFTSVSELPNSADPEWGDLDLHWLNLNSLQQGNYELHDRLGGDDHNNASLYIRPDGRYVAMYSKHSQDQLTRWRISTDPHDLTAWEPEQTYNNNASRTTSYNNTYYLPDDNGGAGRLYNFTRNHNYDPNVQVSYDQGQTWERVGKLVTSGGNSDRPYVRYASDGKKIHVVTSDYHRTETPSSIFHGYVMDGVLYDSFDNVIDNSILDANGVAPANLTPLMTNGMSFNGNTLTNIWPSSVELDNTGNPVVTLFAPIDGDFENGRYFYMRFDGDEWRLNEIAKIGTGFQTPNDNGYWGLSSTDPNNPNVVYISANHDPRTDNPTTNHEIYKGVTADFGKTWTWTAITENSTIDNVRPMLPDWDGNNTFLAWMRGTYYHYLDYDTEAVGIVLSADDPKSLLFKGAANGDWDIENVINWDSGSGTPDDFSNADEVAFDDTATTFSVNVVGPVAPNGVAFNNTSNAYTVTGDGIGGTGNLRVIGGGAVTLNNGANTYSGDTNIYQGTLALQGAATISNSPQINVKQGATLDASGLASTFTLNSGQTLSNNSDNTVVGDVIAGSGATIDGEGVFSDSVTLSSGSTLRVGEANAFDGIPAPLAQITSAEDFESFGTGVVFTNGTETEAPAMPGWTFHDESTGGNQTTWDLVDESGNTVFRTTNPSPTYTEGPVAYAISPLPSQGAQDTITVNVRGDENNDWTDRIIFFDFVDTDNWKYVLVRNNGRTDLTVNNNGSKTVLVNQVDYGSFSGTAFEQLVVTHDSIEGRVTFAVDGNQLFDVTNASLISEGSGATGLGSFNDFVAFDQLAVTTETLSLAQIADMQIDGDLTLSAGASIQFDLHSTNILDRLVIGQTLHAAGEFNVTLASTAPAPQLGDAFDLLDFGSASGQFDTYDLPTLTAGLYWDTSALLTTGVLSVTNVAPGVPGDFDGDGYVGLSDLNILGANWGSMSGASATGDANGDGNVDLADLNLLGANWNPPPAVTIPEPTAGLLMLLSVSACCLRRDSWCKGK